ncbi:chemotaxis protein CheW [Romeria aff. gracilis LEGE 07310]|uniref:Chemotaxis protein CheW n=1 Tax=Vasconcelosia minhoensis LEGE 07310 TaxID=915328 RepID=A0A8J7ARS0_9CYAN|nr:chemotaxis protein CheW [Romeria gracilis]MBE9079381.1 chemotaxis protein CheW [Romeria aff. gracilis LEGE 07310]
MEIDNQFCLIFRHGESIYGLEAQHVREIFPLPELTILADAPKDIVGSLNWRGKLLPVMHLDLRLGQPMRPCQISDSIIVIEWQGIQVGLLVHQVLDVQAVIREAAPDYGRLEQINTAFVAGIAKLGDQLAILLNPETLIRQADEVALLVSKSELGTKTDSPAAALPAAWHQIASERGGSNFYDLYCPKATPAEQAAFRQRAEALHPPLEAADSTVQLSLAVIGLDKAYFAIELASIREFINVQQVTPIPCAPTYILGNINLRGDIMVLADIRTALTQTPAKAAAKAIVVEIDDIVAGILVDAVLDVINLSPAEVMPVPAASSTISYLQGTVRYNDKVLSILNLPALLSTDRQMVSQAA